MPLSVQYVQNGIHQTEVLHALEILSKIAYIISIALRPRSFRGEREGDPQNSSRMLVGSHSGRIP